VAKRRFTDDTDGGRAKSKRAGSDGTIPFSEMRFVRLELSEAEKQDFRSLLAAEEFTSDFLDRVIRAGYKVSLGIDKNGGGFLCSIRAESRDLLDAGLILTGRGKTIATAVAVCEYKSNYLADENGWAAAETRRGGSFDDVG